MNNRVEDHKFETIEKKLAWIEKHRDQIKTVDDKKLKPKLPKPTVESTNGALVGAGAGAASPYQGLLSFKTITTAQRTSTTVLIPTVLPTAHISMPIALTMSTSPHGI